MKRVLLVVAILASFVVIMEFVSEVRDVVNYRNDFEGAGWFFSSKVLYTVKDGKDAPEDLHNRKDLQAYDAIGVYFLKVAPLNWLVSKGIQPEIGRAHV